MRARADRPRHRRGVVDTSVLVAGISAFRREPPNPQNTSARLLRGWVERRTFTWLVSGDILDEYRDVLRRLKVRRATVGRVINLLAEAEAAEAVPAGPYRGLSPDPDAQVDVLVRAGIVRRLLALSECAHSNSLIEAWWRSLKHQWLFLHPLDSVVTVHRLVAFYVDEPNRVIAHAAFRGLTPDEMYFGTAGAGASDLASRVAAARVARLQANRAAGCPVRPALGAAG